MVVIPDKLRSGAIRDPDYGLVCSDSDLDSGFRRNDVRDVWPQGRARAYV